MINNTHGAAFFAALNTANGFCSYFREIFDKVDTVYIIKGGSGTGKSRFMKEVAAAANAKGYLTEAFLCSSDPSSLDGIIVKKLGVAVLDGTAPHVHEPTLVGAREKFLDFSAFLDSDKLKPKREEIKALSAAKAKRYAGIYEYLKVIRVYDSLILRAAMAAFESEKLDKSVKKSMLSIEKGERYSKNIRIRSAVSCEGNIILNTYAKMAKKRFAISDLCGLGGIYLKRLLDRTDAAGISVTVSYDPFAPELPDALYYPDSGVAFYLGTEGDYDETVINMRRFVNDSTLRPYKPEIRALYRLRGEVVHQMDYDFSCVKRLHTALEEIYSAAMRFEGKEELTREFIKNVIT